MITIIVIETVPWELFEWGAAFHEESNPLNFGVTKQPFLAVKVYTDTGKYSLGRLPNIVSVRNLKLAFE